jgi:DNA-binding SARP family transcriptional activator
MCIDQCKKILAIDNLREDAYRLLMQSLARLGRRSDALRAYAGCARSLREELGVAPMKSTSDLVDRIRRDEI